MFSEDVRYIRSQEKTIWHNSRKFCPPRKVVTLLEKAILHWIN
jgi:hypothetical protein